jgi:hypothetical protein
LTEEGADIYAGDVAKYIAKMGIEVLPLACDDDISDNSKNTRQTWHST